MVDLFYAARVVRLLLCYLIVLINVRMSSRMSGGNCKTAYEHAYITPEQVQDEKEGGWRFGLSLRTEHVWDAFIISSLHRQHRQRGVQMQAPHTGEQNVRFTALMQERNEEVIQHGQDELPHFCDKCLRVWQDDEGNWREFRRTWIMWGS